MISIVRIVMPREPAVDKYCRARLLEAIPASAQLVELRQATTVPPDLTKNLLTNYIAALNQCEFETVFVCEWDCLYHASYFNRALKPNHITYAGPGYYLICRKSRWRFAKRRSVPLSSLAGHRDVLRDALFQKLSTVARNPEQRWRAEIMRNEGWPLEHQVVPVPWVDIRHGQNATNSVITGEHLNPLPPWGEAEQLWREIHTT